MESTRESDVGHEHEWSFYTTRGTSTHWAVTVRCDHCDAERTAPVTAAGIARNAVELIIDRTSRVEKQ